MKNTCLDYKKIKNIISGFLKHEKGTSVKKKTGVIKELYKNNPI